MVRNLFYCTYALPEMWKYAYLPSRIKQSWRSIRTESCVSKNMGISR